MSELAGSDVVPASIGQRLMWFLEHYRGGGSSVNCPANFRIRGAVGDDDIAEIVGQLVDRHSALRTSLHRRGRDLVQEVRRSLDVGVTTEHLPAGDEDALHQALREELRTRIPSDGVPVRLRLWRLGDDDSLLCVNMHHLVSDAWSCGIVIDDVMAMLARRAGQPRELADQGWQFSDFARWQHELDRDGTLHGHVDYWTTKLAGMAVPKLRAAGPEPAESGPAELASLSLSAEVGEALRALARQERSTLFGIMLTLYCLLLRQETGQDDIAVSSLFANRTRQEVQRTVGFFANMLVLRTAIDPDDSFSAVVAKARATTLEAVVHQTVPCHMLPLTKLLAEPGRVDDVVFQMLPDRAPESWAPTEIAPGLTVDTMRPPQGMSRFLLNLTIIPRGDRVDARLSYARGRFPHGWADDFLVRFRTLIHAVLEDPGQPVARLLDQPTATTA